MSPLSDAKRAKARLVLQDAMVKAGSVAVHRVVNAPEPLHTLMTMMLRTMPPPPLWSELDASLASADELENSPLRKKANELLDDAMEASGGGEDVRREFFAYLDRVIDVLVPLLTPDDVIIDSIVGKDTYDADA